MIRNLKVLGLALMALFALSAAMAATAPAQENEKGELTIATGNSATLTGTENTGGGAINALTSFGGGIACPGSTYTGHRVLTHEQTTAGSKHQALQNGDTTFTVTPHYKQENCVATGSLGTFPFTIDMTGCDYLLYLGTTTPEGATGTYGVGTDIVCPPNKHIDINVFSDEAHENNICKITITPEGTGAHPGKLTGLHATNNPGGTSISVHGTVHSIGGTNPIHREGLCTLDGKGSTTSAAEFHTDINVTAHDQDGEPVGISISDGNLE